ncbi:MAG: hypothetical protein Q4C72_09060 [Eubacteriales bacterium]|nr:hypothetical protein [Eubacteriales bacterium]
MKKVPTRETFFALCIKTRAHVAGFYENDRGAAIFCFHARCGARSFQWGAPFGAPCFLYIGGKKI